MATSKDLKIAEKEMTTVASITPTIPLEVKSDKTPICPRDEKGRFKKGFSGNPNAWATRKWNTPLAHLCREKVESWVDVLDSLIMGSSVNPVVRLGALRLGLEYGYGKPLQGSEVRDYESQDYNNYIKNLARELHEEFDFRDGNIIEAEQKIKESIARRTENDSFLNKIFDDVLKYVGSHSFQNYIDELNAESTWYKYIE